jgi:hypothetical protein
LGLHFLRSADPGAHQVRTRGEPQDRQGYGLEIPEAFLLRTDAVIE